MRAIAFVLGLVLAATSALADQATQRYTPGASISLQGQVLDLNTPLCIPPTATYTVAYRNSTATGCSVKASDDFATLVLGSTSGTITMPASSTTTFTGSISGNTLTTPNNATSIGAVITGTGVLDNTYVTAGSGTSWTISGPAQTVASETLTQSIYPPGHGTCFKHGGTSGLQTIVAASPSTITGAAGVISGNPAAQSNQTVTLYPGGEVCLQANTSGNYVVSGFMPGVWYQGTAAGSPVSSFQWTGLSGYPQLHLGCSGLGSIGSQGQLRMQLAYGGVFQATGYVYQGWYGLQTASSLAVFSSGNDTSYLVSGFMPVDINHEATLDVNLSFNYGTGMGYSNDMYATVRQNSSGTGEQRVETSGEAPLTTTQAVTGIQLFPAAGTIYGMCKLSPKVK